MKAADGEARSPTLASGEKATPPPAALHSDVDATFWRTASFAQWSALMREIDTAEREVGEAA